MTIDPAAGRTSNKGAMILSTRPRTARPASSWPRPSEPEQQLIRFPFLLAAGDTCYLHLPARLTRNDAERLKAFLMAAELTDERDDSIGDD